MATTEDLLALEHGFWDHGGDPAWYEAHVADDAVVVLPFGLFDKADTVGSMEGSPPWADHRIDGLRTVELGPEAVLLAYEATGRRTGEDDYRAVVTSTYVRREGVWLLAAHQQAPRA